MKAGVLIFNNTAHLYKIVVFIHGMHLNISYVCLNWGQTGTNYILLDVSHECIFAL